MFLINTNYKNVENIYKIQENVALISLLNKKGSKLIAKIDVDDIEKIKTMGTWFAEWHKDFNSYLVQNISNQEKKNLQSVILDTSTKTPIKHINGDTLDNRKCNLEIVQRNARNDYEILDKNTMAIILTDRNGKASSKVLISKEELNNVITDDLNWVEYKTHGNIHVVANTPNGRVYLDKLLMNASDSEIVHHINLNPLDCKRNNMEIVTTLVK